MIDDLLTLAEELARRDQTTARRKAISTAYYAAFHALCELVADALVVDQTSSLYAKIYRHIEHSIFDKQDLFRTNDSDSVSIENIRKLIYNLRQERELSDYAPQSNDYLFNALDAVAVARTVVGMIRLIKPENRRDLALTILVGSSRKSRGTQNEIKGKQWKSAGSSKPRRSKSP